jgi:putative membrane protein
MIYSILINSVAVFITAYILKGVHVKNYGSALLVAIGLALVNTFIKPIIVFLTLPLTIVTFGLFILVINALLLKLIDELMESFRIESFAWAIMMSIVLSIINGLLLWIF